MGLHIMFLWNYFWCNKQSWIDVLQDTLEKAVKYLLYIAFRIAHNIAQYIKWCLLAAQRARRRGLALNASIMLLLFFFFVKII